MLRSAQGHLALWLVRVAAVGGASAVAGCGLFVDFEDGASAATQGAGAAATSGSGAASSSGVGGGAGAGGGGAGAGGGSGEPCKVADAWEVELVAHWSDEVVVDLVLVDGGGVAVANLTPPESGNREPLASDTVIRVVYPRPRATQEFKVSVDNGVGIYRNSVALARGGNGLVVAATAAEGTVHTPATPADLHPGLVAFDVDPATWDSANVRVECASTFLESVDVAAGAEDRIAVAANTFPLDRQVGVYDCGGSCMEILSQDKQLLVWPDAVKSGCPLATGGPAHEASPSLALLEKDLLVSANYAANTSFFGTPVLFGGSPGNDVDRFVARLTQGANGPEVVWAAPAARIWHGTAGGTFVMAPLGDGVLFGGGLYGWLDPTYMPFTAQANTPRLAALARLTAVSGELVKFPPLTLESGLLSSLEVRPGCALVAGVLDNTNVEWLANPGVGRTFVALIDTQTLLPVSGTALPTGVTIFDPPNVFAARGDKSIVVAGVYTGAPTLAGMQLQQANPVGTFVIRVAQP